MTSEESNAGFTDLNYYYLMHCLFFCFFFAEEEAAEVKKSKLYQPATKFVPVSQHVSFVSSAENKKSVSF